MRVAELIERHSVGGTDRQLFLAERDRLVQASPEERDLSEQVVRARDAGVLFERALQLRLGLRLHLEPEHHLRRDHMRGGGPGGTRNVRASEARA